MGAIAQSFDYWMEALGPLIKDHDPVEASTWLQLGYDLLAGALAKFPETMNIYMHSRPSPAPTDDRSEYVVGFTLLQATGPSVAWRTEQLASAAVDAIVARRTAVAALCGRALLELAASACRDGDVIETRWQQIRADKAVALAELRAPESEIRKRLNHFFFGTRAFLEFHDHPSTTAKDNVLTSIDKLQKWNPGSNIRWLYDALSEAAHPNVESALQNLTVGPRVWGRLDQKIMKRIPSFQGPTPENIVIAISLGLLFAAHAWCDLTWVAVDAQLTHQSAIPRKYLTVRAPSALGAACPCGSGRSFSSCTHERTEFGYLPEHRPAEA